MTDMLVGYIDGKEFTGVLRRLIVDTKRTIAPIEKEFKGAVSNAIEYAHPILNDDKSLFTYILANIGSAAYKTETDEYIRWVEYSSRWYVQLFPFLLGPCPSIYELTEPHRIRMLGEARRLGNCGLERIKNNPQYYLTICGISNIADHMVNANVMSVMKSCDLADMRKGQYYIELLEKMVDKVTSATFDNIDVPEDRMEKLAEIRGFVKRVLFDD